MKKYYKRILFTASVFLAAVCAASNSVAQTIDPNFYPLITSGDYAVVNASAVQTDGKVVIAGAFSSANNFPQSNISRLLPDGKTDMNFGPVGVSNGSFAGTIYDLKIQPDGKIIVAGNFNNVGGQARRGVARLNADGTLDASFLVLFYDTNTTIAAVAIQPDGKILIAGNFLHYKHLTRLNADGTIDASFQNSLPAVSNDLTSLILQPDGRFVAAYRYYENRWKTKIARFNANGSVDASFSSAEVLGTGGTSGGSNDVSAMVLQPDGKILIGGSLSSVAGTAKNYFARLNADGSLDNTFTASANGAVFSLALQPDGKILAGGIFTQINAAARNRFARLNADGSLDQTLSAAFTDTFATVYTISLQADGKIITGGQFLKIGNALRYRIARLNADGSLDESFNFVFIGSPGLVSLMARRGDGKIYVAGRFVNINGESRNQFALLNADGSLDQSFGAVAFGSNFYVYHILPLPNNKVMVTGTFNLFAGGRTFSNIVRFNSDGTIDTTLPEIFTNGNAGSIGLMVLQPDGKMIVGGNFTQLGGTARNNVARLNADGTLDTAFQNNAFNFGSNVDKIVLQPDGKILITGSFTQINGLTRNRVARLNPDGSLDTNFQNSLSGVTNSSVFTPYIYDMALQPDGKILIGGSFDTVNGTTRKNLARLNEDGSLDSSFVNETTAANGNNAISALLVRSNGKILIGGGFLTVNGQALRGLAQLNADGSLDTSFSIVMNSPYFGVYSFALEPNGNVLVGGNFGLVNGISRTGALRLLFSNNSRTAFDFDGDGKADISVFRPSNGAWYLLNSTSGFTATQFGVSTDKIVPADFDGDGKTDVTVYRDGTWYLQRSTAGFTGIAFGEATDVPMPADFTGDGKADLAVFRPSNGVWYISNLVTNQFSSVQFGQSGDVPVVADYDGDGRADVAVYRPSAGTWYVQRSRDGFLGFAFGTLTDKPVPADYDGDGKTDVAVFRPENGVWYIQRSRDGFTGFQFGLGTDKPVPADYDGDGRADIAVFRDGTWYLQRSQLGFTGISFGFASDKPVPNALIP